MLCPNCKSDNVFTIDSRPFEETTKRRRKCVSCGYRFNTIEVQKEEMDELNKIRTCLTYLAGQVERRKNELSTGI